MVETTLERLQAEWARREQSSGPSMLDLLQQEQARRQQPEISRDGGTGTWTVATPTPAQGLTTDQRVAIGTLQHPQMNMGGLAAGEVFTGGMSDQARQQVVDAGQSRLDSLGEIIRDNVVGVDNGVMSPGEYIGRMLNTAGESLTLGFAGDETTAAARSALTGQDYDAALTDERARESGFRDQYPGSALAADIGGALFPGAGMGRLAVQGATRAAQATRGALGGAAAGAAIGFTEGEGGFANRVINSSIVSAAGGVFGAVAPRLTDALMNAPRNVVNAFQRVGERPSLEGLEEAARQAYRAVEDAGIHIDGGDLTTMADRVEREALTLNYDPVTDTQMTAALNIMRRVGDLGQIPLTRLDRTRRALWDRVSGPSGDNNVLEVIAGIDDVIGGASGANELMVAARTAYRRFAQTRLISETLESVMTRTGNNGTGGNLANNLRRAVQRLYENPRTARFLDDDLVEEMRAFANGDRSSRVLRLVGNLAPNRGALSTMANIGAAGATGGASLFGSLIAMGAQDALERRVSRGADGLMDITSGTQRTAPLMGQNALATGQIATTAAEGQTEDLRNKLLQ